MALGGYRGGPRSIWGSPKRPLDVSRTPRRALGTSFSSDFGAKARRKARRACCEPFCLAHVESRASCDVHETSVLLGPNTIPACSLRTSARKQKQRKKGRFGLENRVLALQNDARASQNPRRTAQIERKNAVGARAEQQSAYFLASRTQKGAREAKTQSQRGAQAAMRPNPGMRIVEWIIGDRFAPS